MCIRLACEGRAAFETGVKYIPLISFFYLLLCCKEYLYIVPLRYEINTRRIMETDALAIANYFVRKGLSDTVGEKLTLLRLVKYVYIAYGFSLALIDKSIINDRFDRVEAWKYGPVIPSVYHSFCNVLI